MGLAFLGTGIERLVLRSELEGLRENYVSWRNDDRVPTWVAVNRARRGWRGIALRERTFRKWSGWLGILAGAASAGFGVASAFDGSSGRAYAFTLSVTSLVLAASGVRLLTTETPAEAGYRAWLVYVQPLPPADAPQPRTLAAPIVGGLERSGVVGVRGTW